MNIYMVENHKFDVEQTAMISRNASRELPSPAPRARIAEFCDFGIKVGKRAQRQNFRQSTANSVPRHA